MTQVTTARTDSGQVEGVARPGHVSFRGIPFAAPPLGTLRFAAPERPAPWSGVRPARAYGASAMQGEAFAPGAGAEGPTSEDCLYLNVFTPAVDGGKRPVLVFIHGGGFIVGSSASATYAGGRLAEFGNQVVVSFNYRLGSFGYLCAGEDGRRAGFTPNCGTLDQIAALEWVRRNIGEFGGDPDRVTIFGESAGGSSVLHLLAAPAAEGRFHRAISQSPPNGFTLPDPETALEPTAELLGHLGIAAGDVERLRDVPAEALRDAQVKVRGRPGDWLGFFPVRDAASLPVAPAALFASGGGARVPLIVGANRDEWNLFEIPMRAEESVVVDFRKALLARGFPPDRADHIDALVATYRRSRSEHGLPAHDRAIYRAIAGDLRFRIATIRAAETHAARGLPTYAYHFAHESPALAGNLGSCHALELAFVFGTLSAPMQDQFAGSGPDVEALSGAMMGAWTAFALAGTPGSVNGTEWPLFDAAARKTQVFATPCRVEEAPLEEERAAWDGVI